jgi:hypothetical protein
VHRHLFAANDSFAAINSGTKALLDGHGEESSNLPYQARQITVRHIHIGVGRSRSDRTDDPETPLSSFRLE